MDYLSTLNEKQLEAVQETEGFLRVIAGAGSGKTKLLVSRYAYLVKEYGIDSANGNSRYYGIFTLGSI